MVIELDQTRSHMYASLRTNNQDRTWFDIRNNIFIIVIIVIFIPQKKKFFFKIKYKIKLKSKNQKSIQNE